MNRIILLLAICALAGCKRPESTPATATPTPVPTPEEGFAGIPETATPTPGATATAAPTAPSSPAEPVGQVEAPATVNMDVTNAENELVKNEVLSRIDVMPNLSPEEKDKLYVQVERARGMGKIVTIPFSSGKTAVGATEVAALKETAKLPQIQKYAEDPTVVFVVLGFADKKGDPKGNQAISLERAESVVKALKERCGVMNLSHAVGMGGSEMFDAKNFDKNRVVEVWAVLP